VSKLARRRELVTGLDDRSLARRHGFGRGNGLPGGHLVGKDLLDAATLLLGHLVIARVEELLLWEGYEGIHIRFLLYNQIAF